VLSNLAGLSLRHPAVLVRPDFNIRLPSRQAALRKAKIKGPANTGFKITINCAMHKALGDSPGNIEFRAFPQWFLNLLETPAA
jgi:hypothetical protein